MRDETRYLLKMLLLALVLTGLIGGCLTHLARREAGGGKPGAGETAPRTIKVRVVTPEAAR